jgi:tyrosyl-tRNA synthetase
MSKSLDNAIGIADAPEEMYGRLMSISDAVMVRYADLLSETRGDLAGRLASGSVHPMAAKKGLAHELVTQFHGAAAAEAAQRFFEQRFQQREAYAPEERVIPVDEPGGLRVFSLVWRVGFAASTSEARRLVGQRAVRIDDAVVEDPNLRVPAGSEVLLSVGRRRIARIRLVDDLGS